LLGIDLVGKVMTRRNTLSTSMKFIASQKYRFFKPTVRQSRAPFPSIPIDSNRIENKLDGGPIDASDQWNGC
jgi:hypothetical protein